MTIAAGTRLGPYEILSPLGAGGMGEVYRARDARLGREVAVKVLPAGFACDEERMRRFEQEACATGALNHANILVVYDIGTQGDGSPYVVSELLEGTTLRERLREGKLPQRKAIDYALQIAHGLAAAHERGIIHRDLKPENLFITKDERVKILDFGLAKLTEPDGEQTQTEIPTRRVETNPGVVMGTVGYMAPEQMRGHTIDHRVDIFSFGCILYEMLTGRRAFGGESAADTISAVLKEDPPDISSSNPHVTPAVERLVVHCLEKNPARRFQSANDLAFAVEAVSSSNSVSAQTVTTLDSIPDRRTKRERVAWIVLSGLLLTTLGFALLYSRRPSSEPPAVARFQIYPPEKTELRGSFAVSPDGRRVVMRGITEGKVMLWMRAIDSLTAQPVAGTEEAIYPFWSPDSRFIGFFSGGKLKRVEASGGPIQTLCDAPDGRGGTWNADGVIVFAPKDPAPLYRVSAAGGTPVQLTTLDISRKEVSHFHPQFLPDGRHFLYLANGPERDKRGIYVSALDKLEPRLLVNTDVSAAYAAPGYLLFLQERTLMAQAFDAGKLEINGEPVPVAEEVDRLGQGARFALFSVSSTGVLVYRSGSSETTQLTWFDRQGKQVGTAGPVANYSVPWISPDEKRVAFNRIDAQSANSDIWIIELTRGTLTRFTFEPSSETAPVWSPDGTRIAFSSDRESAMNIYQRAASGVGNDELLVTSDHRKFATDWSKDGNHILYQEQHPSSSYDIWVAPLSGDRKPFPFQRTNFDERQARFSPDGKLIAYASNESGVWQVYVQSFPASGGKWQISTNGGSQPQWRRDGKELFYTSPDRKLMAVDVKADGPTFEASVPKVLIELHVQSVGLPGPRNFYAATGDGKRFLIPSLLGEPTATPTTVVVNWTADLKR